MYGIALTVGRMHGEKVNPHSTKCLVGYISKDAYVALGCPEKVVIGFSKRGKGHYLCMKGAKNGRKITNPYRHSRVSLGHIDNPYFRVGKFLGEQKFDSKGKPYVVFNLLEERKPAHKGYRIEYAKEQTVLTKPPKERLYTPDEAAQMLSVNRKTLLSWTYRKRMGSVKVGSLVRFRKSDIEAMIETAGENENKF